jgi:hypothetical protein
MYNIFEGLLGWGVGPSQGLYVHRTAQTQKGALRVGSRTKILVLECSGTEPA